MSGRRRVKNSDLAVAKRRLRKLLTESPTPADLTLAGTTMSTTPAATIVPDTGECRLGGSICNANALCTADAGGAVSCFCFATGRTIYAGQRCPVRQITLTGNNSEDSEGEISHIDLAKLMRGTGDGSLGTNLTSDPRLSAGSGDGSDSDLSWGGPNLTVLSSTAAPHGVASTNYATFLVAVTLTGATGILLLLALVCWMRRWSRIRKAGVGGAGSGGHHASGGWYYCCLWRKAKTSVGLQALGKPSILDSQQFTSNPNYYTSPPEMALLKSLLHLEISSEKLAFLDVIGEGCFGKVFKGVFRKSDSDVCEVAIKILKENSSNETQLDFLREVEIMSSFDHRNILTLLGVVVVENGATPWMVFEYMEYGDLAELLRENSSQFWSKASPLCKITKNDLQWIATQVASGMSYLNSQHFVHRDLATRNCLVGNNLAVKISDFGMSRDIYTCDYYKIGGSRLLPVRWMAPESVMYGKFTLESDIWSFGVVLWEIFAFGKQPYYGHSNEEVVKLIRQGILLTPPDDCPRYICQLMETCWKTNPYDRARFPEILDFLASATSAQHPEGDGCATILSKSVYLNVDVHPEDVDATDSQNYLVPRSAYM